MPKVLTNEINDEATIRATTSGRMKKGFTIRGQKEMEWLFILD